jgi:putative peptide zinc metalloprotease protein
VGIVLFIADQFFFVGVVLAVLAAVNMFLWPALKGARFLLSSPRLRRNRLRAVTVSALLIAGFLCLICLVPVPLRTHAEGVVWIPENAFVRPGTDGFVDRLRAEPGSLVEKSDVLMECSDPLLPAQIRVLEAKVQELESVYNAQILADRVKAEITREELGHIRAKLADARERADRLIIRSGGTGRFVVPKAQDMPGRFVKRGELLGYVIDPSALAARVVVSQGDVDLVRGRTHGVDVRFPESIREISEARLLREVPAATNQLPGRALALEGGGEIPVDPQDRLGTKAFQKVFLFDLGLPSEKGFYCVGGRVYARFDHGLEPLVQRWYRAIRQVFLKRFNV